MDVPILMIATAAMALSWRFKEVPEPLLILAAGLAGVALKGTG